MDWHLIRVVNNPVVENSLPMAEFAITFAKATVIITSCEYAIGQVVPFTPQGRLPGHFFYGVVGKELSVTK